MTCYLMSDILQIYKVHMSNYFNPLAKRENLSHTVSGAIETAIRNKIILIGAKLPSEFELSQQFNVSRATIREALRDLVAKGIISIQKGKGAYVQGMSSEHVTNQLHSYLVYESGGKTFLDLINARLIIEPSIAESAALNRTDEDIAILADDVAKLADKNGSSEEMAIRDMNFHIHISDATHNSLLAVILKPVFELLPKLKQEVIKKIPDAIESAQIWHNNIYIAIKEGNGKLAYSHMVQHLALAKTHAEKVLKII